MPVRVCSVDDLVPHKRGRKSALENLEELAQLKTKLSHGLKPYEAIEVELPRSPVKNLRDSFKTRVVSYLRELDIQDYEVQAYDSQGKSYVAVIFVPPNNVALEKMAA
jgi:hypothetical protein